MSEQRPEYGNQTDSDLENQDLIEVVKKIRNYYNIHHNIDGRPPSKIDFNDYLDAVLASL